MNNSNGSITVFLSIIFLSIFSIGIVFIELSRIESAKYRFQLSGNNSIYSVMSYYDRDLKDYYGLYAFDTDTNSEYEEFEKYMILNTRPKGHLDIYDFKLEDVNITMDDSLGNTNTLRRQILDYMKYRGPSQYVLDFMNKADIIKTIPTISSSFSKRLQYERKAYSLAKLGEKLNTKFNGDKQSFISSIISFIYSKEELYVDKLDDNKLLRDISSYIDEVGDAQELEDYELRNNLLTNLNREYLDIINDVADYKDIFNDIETIIDEVYVKLNDLNNAKTIYQESLDSLPDNIRELRLAPKAEDIEIEYLKDNDLELLKKHANNNQEKLMDLIDNLDECNPYEGISSQKRQELRNITEDISVDEYDYRELESNKKYKTYDNRRGVMNSVKSLLIMGSGNGASIPYDTYTLLPSKSSNHNEIMNDFELLKRDSMGSSERIFNHLEYSYLNKAGKNTMEKVLINEYIMSTFKHLLSEKSYEVDSRYRLKKQRPSYFTNGEIEYILSGKNSEVDNVAIAKQKILMIRFCFNTLHVYGCKEKQELANATAVAVGGLFTGGAGIPIIRSLILMSWSMAESVYDVGVLTVVDENNKLRSLPIYKTEEDWATSITPKENGVILEKDFIKSESGGLSIEMNYTDYLRFLLLIQDEATSLKRIQDLLLLNSDTNIEYDSMDSYKTSIYLEARASIKYIWLFDSRYRYHFNTSGYFKY